MYYLRSMALRGVFEALSTGIRVRTCDTNWGKLREIVYLLPPINEQKEIANYLDKKCAEIEEIIKNKSLESGQINIGISETAMRLYLLDKLQEFHKDYPHVRLKISNHSTPQAIDALEKGLVDIAMVTSPLEIRKPLRKTALRSYHDILIGGSAYKTTASRKRSLKELADFSFVSLSAGTGTNDLYVRFFYENHLRFSPDMEVATTDQILPMVRCNLGIGFCPEGIARPAIERKEVFEIELEEEIPERQITIVEDSGKPQSIAVQKLLTYFK